MPAEQRKDIRARMRRLRGKVDPSGRAIAAAGLCARLIGCDFYESAQRIAAYFPNDSEIDTAPIIRHAWQAGKSIYLPVLAPGETLGFAIYRADTQLYKNRYGIAEPKHAAADTIGSAELDLVLMPLVAFDSALFRLGMGGGYYDKTFSFLRNGAIKRPLLVGTGYEFQRVETVLPEPWDVPATYIVTDKTIHK